MKLWSLCSMALFPCSFRCKGLFPWSSLLSSQKKSWGFALENMGCSLQARAPTLLDFVGPEFQENIEHQKHRPNSIKNGSKQLGSSSWQPVTLYAFFHSDQSEGSHTFGRSVGELPHFLPFNVRAPILLDI